MLYRDIPAYKPSFSSNLRWSSLSEITLGGRAIRPKWRILPILIGVARSLQLLIPKVQSQGLLLFIFDQIWKLNNEMISRRDDESVLEKHIEEKQRRNRSLLSFFL